MKKINKWQPSYFFIICFKGVFYSSFYVFLFCFSSPSFALKQQIIEAKTSNYLSIKNSDRTYQRESSIPQNHSFHIDQNSMLMIYNDTINAKNLTNVLLSNSSKVFPKMEKDFDIALNEKITLFLISDLKKHSNVPLINAGPEWAAGSAYPPHYLMIIRTNRLGQYPDMDITSVFVHELSHIFLYHALKESRMIVPTWFNEGIAMLEARKWGMRDSYELASSLIVGSYIPLDALRSSFPREQYEARRAYVESFSFLTYLAENYGESSIWLIISKMKEGYDFDESFSMIFGKEVRQIEEKWISEVTFWYRWIPVATSSITLWIAVTLLFIFGYIRKKSRERKILKEWEEEDRWYL